MNTDDVGKETSSSSSVQDDDDKGGTQQQHHESELERLTSLWPTLERELQQKLKKGDPITVQALSKLFPESDYPKLKPDKHCVWCHTMYDGRSDEQCKIKHDCGDYERISKWHNEEDGVGSRWKVKCQRCGKKFKGDSDDCDIEPQNLVRGYCWNDYHDDNPRERTDLPGKNQYDFEDCVICQKMVKEQEEEHQRWMEEQKKSKKARTTT